MKTVYVLFCWLSATIVLFFTSATAQTSWEKVYTGATVRSIEPTSDGGYVVAGKQYSNPNIPANGTQAVLHKIAANGNLIWSQTYWNNLASSSLTEIGAVVPTPNGGVVGVATVRLTNSPFNNFYLFKTDATGQIVWTSSVGDTATYKTARGLLRNADGTFTLLGESVSAIDGGSYNTRTYLIKTDSLGGILWQKTFDGKTGKAFAATADGAYVITGGLQSSLNYYQNAYHLWKTDNLGNLVWQHTGDLDVVSNDLVVQSDGSIVTIGSQLRKHDATGNPVWTQSTQSGNSITIATDGNLVITGALTPSTPTTNQLRLVKVSGTGSAIWSKAIGVTGADETGYVVTATADGGVIAGGTSNANNIEQMYVVKTTSLGNASLLRPEYIGQNPFVPATVAPLSTVTISCQSKNSGLAAGGVSTLQAFLSTDNVLDASDFSLGTASVLAVSAGGVQNTNISAIFPDWASGNYFVIFGIDHQKQVFEANESNNSIAIATTLQGSATGGNSDLVLSTASLSNTTAVAANSTVLFNATIANNGIGAAASSNLSVYLSSDNVYQNTDLFLANFPTNALLPSQTQTYTAQSFLIPAGVTAGNYFIIWVADATASLSETNENNNSFSVALTVTNTASDLVVINQTAPSTANIGSDISLNCTVSNLSTLATTSSVLKYYLSTDNFFSANDIYLGESNVAAIAGNASTNIAQNITLSNTLVAGSYSILFVADANNTVAETNENNNVAVRTMVLSSSTGQADLIVQNTLAPATALAGSSIALSCKVTNQGSATALASQLKYYLSTDLAFGSNDVLLGASGVPSLAPATNVTLSSNVVVPATTSPASYYILFRADADQQVAESNEANNNSLRSMSVSNSLPDLIIQNQNAPNSATVGSSINLSCRVRNQGSAMAGASTTKYYLSTDALLSVSDVLLGESSVSSINAAAFWDISKTIVLPSTLSNGNYYLIFQADAATQIPESNETNNTTIRSITIGVLPDLMCQNLSAPLNGTLGSTINLACRVRNQGGGNTVASVVKYYLSTDAYYGIADIYLGENAISPLAAGVYVDVSQTAILPANINAGNYYILFRADATFQNTESNESNNTLSRTISLTNGAAAAPDLNPSNLSLSTLETMAGNSIDITYVVNNLGTGDASSSTTAFFLSTDAFYQTSDVLLATNSIPSIVGNGNSGSLTQTVTIPTSSLTATYYIIVLTDYTGQISENNETNNLVSQSLSVTATTTLPDLITDNIIQPLNVNLGTPINVSCRVVNIGVATAAANQVRFYLSANSVFNNSDIYLGGADVPSLPMSSSVNINKTLAIPSTVAAGSYYILYRTDALNVVAETNEINNLGATPINLTNNNANQIDLEMTASASPTIVATNTSVNILLTVKNTVNVTASNLVIQTPLLQNLGYSNHTSNLGNYSQGTNTWTIPSLAFNETATLTITAYNINTSGTQTLFTQVLSVDQMDTDSTPNNNNSATPLEDDEAVTTISFAPNSQEGKHHQAEIDNQIVIAPNPAQDVIRVQHDNSNGVLFVYDLQGKLVLSQYLQTNTTSIDIAALPKGLYFLQMGEYSSKFIKE